MIEPNDLICESCRSFDTAYIAKNRAIGCYSCGIHPDLDDTSDIDTSDSPDAVSNDCGRQPESGSKPSAAQASEPMPNNIGRRPAAMRRAQVDFAAINQAALARWQDVLGRLLPGGRAHGNEWIVGSLRGEAGYSLKVRLRGSRMGVWCDFATGESGGDPVSLAAAVAGVSQSEGARQLARMLGMTDAGHAR
ncbi:hypothetical protein [Roseomonas sp. 18066]|uniref:hypothetical protein n=1 Tax=Roseomonas sp. 18066 TaxID=2681412 RepID=UPI001F29EA0F|nr:hypothetical protein [Roseomonas sp. 18066]